MSGPNTHTNRVKLLITFDTVDEMLEFTDDIFAFTSRQVSVVQADALQREWGGRPPANGYVLRGPHGERDYGPRCVKTYRPDPEAEAS